MIYGVATIVDSRGEAINSRVVKNHVSAFAHTLHVQVCIISESMLQSDMYRAAT